MKPVKNKVKAALLCLCDFLPRELKIPFDRLSTTQQELYNLVQNKFGVMTSDHCFVTKNGSCVSQRCGHHQFNDEMHSKTGFYETKRICPTCSQRKFQLIPHKPWKVDPQPYSSLPQNRLARLPLPTMRHTTAAIVSDNNLYLYPEPEGIDNDSL